MTAESPEHEFNDTDPNEVATVAQLCVREDNGEQLEAAALQLLSYARKLKQRGGRDD
jgi:hypothetical protein